MHVNLSTDESDDPMLMIGDPIPSVEGVLQKHSVYMNEGTWVLNVRITDLPNITKLFVTIGSNTPMFIHVLEELLQKLDYQLIEITEELWAGLVLKKPAGSDLLFTHKSLQKQPWVTVQDKLKSLNSLLHPGIFIAGGAVFSALFGTPSSDVDLFLYGADSVEAEATIRQLVDTLTSRRSRAQEAQKAMVTHRGNKPPPVARIQKDHRILSDALATMRRLGADVLEYESIQRQLAKLDAMENSEVSITAH